MRIRWAPAAAADLESIHEYLEVHQPSFALPTVRRLYEAAQSLKRFPNRGRAGQMPGTRELILSPLPYIIVYGISVEIVHIYRILHTSEEHG